MWAVCLQWEIPSLLCRPAREQSYVEPPLLNGDRLKEVSWVSFMIFNLEGVWYLCGFERVTPGYDMMLIFSSNSQGWCTDVSMWCLAWGIGKIIIWSFMDLSTVSSTITMFLTGIKTIEMIKFFQLSPTKCELHLLQIMDY